MMPKLRLAALLLALAGPAAAQVPPQLDRLHRADGAQVVPDRFLRRWDPVTILFDADAGPAQAGAEDAPERLVTLSPPKPGAWTWLGPRTLQFRPTEPWEPLRRERVTLAGPGASGHATTLVPLLPVPTATGPADLDGGTADLDTVALAFDQPVDVAALARLLTITLTPQAGTPQAGTPQAGTPQAGTPAGTGGPRGAQTLTAQDYDIRPVERTGRGATQSYLVVLHRPVPDGQVATLRLRLSDEPGLDDPSFSLALRSAVPFRLGDAYCGDAYDHAVVDDVVRCTPSGGATAGPRRLALQFSSKPEELDALRLRDVVRVSPPVDDLSASAGSGNELRLSGRFAADQVYEVAIAAGALHDARGRALGEAVRRRFSFAAGTPSLAWDVTQGIVERLGPQMVPLRGHGYDHADIRVHPIDPLSRDFWPFPHNGLVTSDDLAPPLPGEEPRPYREPTPISGDDMAARIAALGSPAASELLALPIRRGGVDAKFGLDLAPTLARISGPGTPGTYLVGLRAVDGAQRHWARLQVTDLSLTTVEEADRVRFAVTSMATAAPVAGAQVRVEGTRDGRSVTLAQGTTAADGGWTMLAPLARGRDGGAAAIGRIVVEKADDTLVLEPQRGPQQYAHEAWSRPDAPWLGWTTGDLAERRPEARTLCHVFTERPIYRPEEPVLIAGIVRRQRAGTLSLAGGDGGVGGDGDVVITGPGEQEWRLPAALDEAGGFHVRFDQKTEATGDYAIRYQPKGGGACDAITVKKEAYRLPTFEVMLNGPARAPLDAPFSVDLLARFFAGGTLSDRPVAWRVTQAPYVWTPPGRPGFLFSSDSRFAGEAEFRSTAVLNRATKTGVGGSAQLTLDPTIEPTAQPRQYLVEATVTGDDDMQVRGTQRVDALPPFVLGVKVARYLPRVGAIEPEVLALDGAGQPVAGLAMTVRLIHRQWNSVLQASDFAQGSAKYQTQVIDETVEEREVTSGAQPVALHLGASEAGVYLVEATARDRVGRVQTVRADLFMAGDTPVTWQAPPAQTVAVSTDKERYEPGETATLLIQSPFQTARALAVVELPEGRFRTEWVEIANGFGRYAVTVRKQDGPRLAVHFLVMRGRLPATDGEAAGPAAPFDQRKPVTLAATGWVAINPTDNRVKVSLEAPAEARPEQELDLVLRLADAAGHPLAGEATVWMVDQAVLSLAREEPLDPLPAFIVDRPSRMAARDTRGMAFGVIPLAESPGGDEAGDFGLANISVRRNFTPVPLYVPRVKVGADGTARVHVKLPDSLTVFMLRAVAVSGADRFGDGAGEMRVRQPIVAQPVLPRFVRPGDVFDAGLLGRIIEGAGGPGRAVISVEHLAVQGPSEQALAWDGQAPVRVDSLVSVPEPAPGVASARVRFLLQRTADRASDAVQVDLPIRPDRPVVHRSELLSLGAGGSLTLPPLADPARPASYARSVTVATDLAVTQLVAGAATLARPAVEGTEQRMALARGELALLPFTPLLDAAGLRGRLAADIGDAMAAIRQATDDDGLVAFFPHGQGSVWLTAGAYGVMVAAGRAGLAVDRPAIERMAKVLAASLRSDYPHLMSREALFERASALLALADGGRIAGDDAAELARRAPELRTGAAADVATVLARLPDADPGLLAGVLEAMWGRVNLLARDGRPVYAGLVDRDATPTILPSEARSLAEVMQAVATATPSDPRLAALRAGLLGLAGRDGEPAGWGSTNATAAALQALAAAWQAPATPARAVIGLPDRATAGTLDHDHPLLQAATGTQGETRVQGPSGAAVLAATDYVPLPTGAAAQADQHGLALTRTLFRVPAEGPMTRLEPGADGSLHLAVGEVVEELDELVNPAPRGQVAMRLPLAAGLEPLNPALATAAAEATPSAPPTLAPSWTGYGDDEVAAVWLQLPAGTYALRTRMRASTAGSFIEPPASAETLYQRGITAATAGARIVVVR